jgi:Uncharacterised P-loop hydrolase UPF0079.
MVMNKDRFIHQIQSKDVIVLQGIPGSGKSTLAKEIKDKFLGTAQTFSADYGMMFQGTYMFQPEKLEKCHRDCFRDFLFYLNDTDLPLNHSIAVVDNTNTSNLEIAPYMATAKAYGRRCYVATLYPDTVEGAIKRQLHGVPAKKVYSMAQRIENSQKNMPSYWEHIVIE